MTPLTKPVGHWAAVDHTDLAGKLLLRRAFLTQYHTGQPIAPVVLDCCQGEGRLWHTLRQEFTVQYWGVDQKPRHGRLKIDSVRLLTRPALPYDVIDIDTYGAPWAHWAALVRNVVKPTTVFLTVGWAVGGVREATHLALDTLGLGRLRRIMPPSLGWKLADLSLDAFMATSYIAPLRITDFREVIPESHGARYFGVRLVPGSSSTARIEGSLNV
jgi:hypothetical protein